MLAPTKTKICDNCQVTIAKKECPICSADLCEECLEDTHLSIISMRPGTYVLMNDKVDVPIKSMQICQRCRQFLKQFDHDISSALKDDPDIAKANDILLGKLQRLRVLYEPKVAKTSLKKRRDESIADITALNLMGDSIRRYKRKLSRNLGKSGVSP